MEEGGREESRREERWKKKGEEEEKKKKEAKEEEEIGPTKELGACSRNISAATKLNSGQTSKRTGIKILIRKLDAVH